MPESEAKNYVVEITIKGQQSVRNCHFFPPVIPGGWEFRNSEVVRVGEFFEISFRYSAIMSAIIGTQEIRSGTEFPFWLLGSNPIDQWFKDFKKTSGLGTWAFERFTMSQIWGRPFRSIFQKIIHPDSDPTIDSTDMGKVELENAEQVRDYYRQKYPESAAFDHLIVIDTGGDVTIFEGNK